MTIDPSNFENCIARIAARGSMGKNEALDLLAQVADRAEQMRATGIADPHVAAAKELAQKLRDQAKEDRADAIRNMRIRNERFNEIAANGIGNAASRIRSLLYWVPGNDPKANVQTLSRSLSNDWASAMFARLKKGGLLKAAASPDYFGRIAEEMWNIEAGKATAAAATDPARQIAGIISPVFEAIRQRLNSAGARIADAKDYAGHTAHDPYLMRRGPRGSDRILDADDAFGQWWKTAEPRLAERTFEDVTPGENETTMQARQRFGRSVWEALVTGVHKPMPGEAAAEEGFIPRAFMGTNNLAQRLSEGRVLFWQDANSWSEYMQAYGKPTSMYELAANTIDQGGKKAALMELFGTNPTANFNQIIRRVQESFRSDVDGVNKFSQDIQGSLTQPNLDNVMAQLDGRGNVPVNQLYHAIGSTVRLFYDMVYLGFVGWTHAASVIATFPSEARFHGINSFSALGGLARGLVRNLGDTERTGVLSDLGAYGDGVSRSAFNSMGHGWNVPGVVAAAHQRYMAATLLPYLADHAKAGMREMLSANLGRQVGSSYEALPPYLQKTLGLYGIKSPEWDLLRAAGTLPTMDGKAYLTPTNALSMDPAGVEALLRQRGIVTDKTGAVAKTQAIDKFRRDVADGLMMYFGDAADHAIVTGGVRERAMLRGSSRPGSLQDELTSALMQFKTWPIAAAHQVLGRELYQSLSKKDAVWGIGAVMGLSMLGGYLRMTARDLATGTEPRVPTNAGDASKIALASLAQGGGLGIFGDFLFGEANRFGASNLSSFGGPVATDMSELYGIYNRWLQGLGKDQKQDVWPELARFGISHVPFANLFYLKGSLDYLAWYHLYEAMNPGWWERTNRRMARQEGRTMMGYAPGAGVPSFPPVPLPSMLAARR